MTPTGSDQTGQPSGSVAFDAAYGPVQSAAELVIPYETVVPSVTRVPTGGLRERDRRPEIRHYRLNGNQITELTSGTWSLGTPDVRANLRPSFSAAKARPASKVRPATTLNISFDGFCDGMQIFSPSVGLGGKTVDGSSTGCVTSGLMGSKTKILNKGAYVITTPEYEGPSPGCG